jgi:hypothetical protein
VSEALGDVGPRVRGPKGDGRGQHDDLTPFVRDGVSVVSVVSVAGRSQYCSGWSLFLRLYFFLIFFIFCYFPPTSGSWPWETKLGGSPLWACLGVVSGHS